MADFYTVSFLLVAQRHVCLNLAVFCTMAQWGSCSLKQSKGNIRGLQATKNNSPTKNSRRTGNALFFSLSLSSSPSSDSPRKGSTHQNNEMRGSKNGGVQKCSVAYTDWMITMSRVQLQQQMYDASEQRRGIKRAWRAALVDRTKQAEEQEGKIKEEEEEMLFVLCPQVMPALFTNDCCRKTRDERLMKRK